MKLQADIDSQDHRSLVKTTLEHGLTAYFWLVRGAGWGLMIVPMLLLLTSLGFIYSSHQEAARLLLDEGGLLWAGLMALGGLSIVGARNFKEKVKVAHKFSDKRAS